MLHEPRRVILKPKCQTTLHHWSASSAMSYSHLSPCYLLGPCCLHQARHLCESIMAQSVQQKFVSHSFLCGTRQDTAASGGSHLLPFLLTEYNLTLTKCNESKQILVWLCHQWQSKLHLFKTLDLKLFIIHTSKTVGPGPPSSSVGRACNPCTEAAMLHAKCSLSRYPFLSAPKLSCQTKALKYPNNYKWTIDCGLRLYRVIDRY